MPKLLKRKASSKTKKSSKKTKMVNTASRKNAIKQILALAETKSLYQKNSANLQQGIPYATNLVYSIAQGDQGNQLTGQKFYIKNIRVHYALHQASAGKTLTCRVMIFQDKAGLGVTGSNVPITWGDVSRDSGPALGPITHADLALINVLHDELFTVSSDPQNASANGTTGTKIGIIDVKLNKTVFRRSDTDKFLKEGDYYMLIAVQDQFGTIGTTITGAVNLAWTVNFKDM